MKPPLTHDQVNSLLDLIGAAVGASFREGMAPVDDTVRREESKRAFQAVLDALFALRT